MALGMFFGLGIAIAGISFALLAVAIVIVPVLIIMPLEQLLWGLLVSTFMVSGSIQYFGGVQKAFWLPYLIGLLILVRFPVDLNKLRDQVPDKNTPTEVTLSVACYLLFIGVAIVSTALNTSPVLQVLISCKEYVGVMGVFFPFAAGLVSLKFFDRLWVFFMWLVPLQIPAVIYQYFVIMPSRRGDSPWDAVTGLFGGNPEGGGASGAMTLFVLIAAIIAISKWRQETLRKRYMFVVVGSALVCIGLAEAKFTLFLIPVSIVLMSRRELIKRPLRSLTIITCAALATLGLLFAYKAQFTHNGISKNGKSIEGYVESIFANNFDTRLDSRSEIGRIAAIKFWGCENPLTDPLCVFFGHGIGATKVGETVVGEVARRYPFHVDRTSIVIYLWEVGIVGLVCVLILLAFVILTAARLENDCRLSAKDRAVMTSVLVALVIIAAELIYHTNFANVPQWQLLVVMLLGYVSTTARNYAPHPSAAKFRWLGSHSIEINVAGNKGHNNAFHHHQNTQ